MRKTVTKEMIATAVDHFVKRGEHPSRAKVMIFMASKDNGDCAGDPGNVSRMIREYRESTGKVAGAPVPVKAPPIQPLPPRIEEALGSAANSLEVLVNSLGESLAVELSAIKNDLVARYDQMVAQIRQESECAINEARGEEQEALAEMCGALEIKSLLEDELQLARTEATGASAVAEERGDQVKDLELAIERTRGDAAAQVAELRTELDAARSVAQEAQLMVRERSSRVAELEQALTAAQAELGSAREATAAARAAADERTARISALETLMANTVSSQENMSHAAVKASETVDLDSGYADAAASKLRQPEAVSGSDGTKGNRKPSRSQKPAVQAVAEQLEGDGNPSLFDPEVE